MSSGWELPAGAFEWIEKNIPFGSKIVELGSGYGSVRLSKNYEVTSIEHNEFWLNLAPSKYIHAEITPYSIDVSEGLWYDPEKIERDIPKKYDLLIIDGPPSDIGRIGIMHFKNIFYWDCYVLVDDTHRTEEKIITKDLISKQSFSCLAFTEYYEPSNTYREFTILTPER